MTALRLVRKVYGVCLRTRAGEFVAGTVESWQQHFFISFDWCIRVIYDFGKLNTSARARVCLPCVCVDINLPRTDANHDRVC